MLEPGEVAAVRAALRVARLVAHVVVVVAADREPRLGELGEGDDGLVLASLGLRVGHHLLVREHVHQRLGRPLRLARIGAVGDGDVDLAADVSARGQVLHLAVDEQHVRDGDDVAGHVPDLGRLQLDVVHDAPVPGEDALELDPVADDEGPVHEDRDRAEQVLDRVLRREAERESDDAEAEDERRHVHAHHVLQEEEDRDQDDQRAQDPPQDDDHHLVELPALPAARLAPGDRRDRVDDRDEEEREGHEEQEARQLEAQGPENRAERQEAHGDGEEHGEDERAARRAEAAERRRDHAVIARPAALGRPAHPPCDTPAEEDAERGEAQEARPADEPRLGEDGREDPEEVGPAIVLAVARRQALHRLAQVGQAAHGGGREEPSAVRPAQDRDLPRRRLVERLPDPEVVRAPREELEAGVPVLLRLPLAGQGRGRDGT